MKVAFVGLGVMGFPMAGHLARAGHEVSVFNRSPAKADAWTQMYGGRAGATRGVDFDRHAQSHAEGQIVCRLAEADAHRHALELIQSVQPSGKLAVA